MAKKKKFSGYKKNYSDLKTDKYVQKWLANIKPTTHRQRLAVFREFLNFIEKTPEELILEHSKDLAELDPIKRTNIAKKQVEAFFKYLKDEKHSIFPKKKRKRPVSHNSARIKAYSMVNSFYSHNQAKIDFGRNGIPKTEKKGVKDKTWRNGEDKERISNEDKKDWLKKIYNQFDSHKNKAIFLCMKSSGLDAVDLFKLKISDYRKGFFKNHNICYVEGNRSKTKETFQTFFDSEACDEISAYLKDRERRGEELTEKSWLFVGDKLNRKGIYPKMKYSLFAHDLLDVCRILELKNITCKSLRSWFDSNVKKGLDAELYTVSERMMGHKTDITAKYQQILKDPEEFANFYKDEIEPKLLILGRSEYVKKINDDIETLQNTIQMQSKQIDEIKNENKNLKENFQETIEQNEKNMHNMMKLIEKLQKQVKSEILQ